MAKKSAGELVAAEGERSRNEWRSLHPALQEIIRQNEREQKAAKTPDHSEKVERSRSTTAYQSDPVPSSVAVKVKGDQPTGERSRR